jgi:crotonobetainyl-CoA:carnitine CoA-transferase CaiB-like acyl-CoA transferase
MLPLSGIKVIEIGTVLMAPYAGQWLADMGADVIKVEPPGGDQTRSTGPAVEPGMAAMYIALNRNKRSIVLDLRNATDREIMARLIDSADVVIHNIRQQKLAKLGIDAATLTARNPRLIYAALQGFSPAGRYGERPAYDDIIQGMSGTAELVRRQTGTLRYVPMALADKTTGIVAAMAISAALAGRERTGRGMIVETPMFETMVAFNMVENFAGSHFASGTAAMGYGRTLASDRGPYRTSDGDICFMPYTDRQWRSFFNYVGREDLCADPQFADMHSRTVNIAALYAILAEILRGRTSAEWLALADEAQIPSAPVLSLEEIVDDPHLGETGFYAETEDPAMGTLRYPGVPLRFDGVRPGVRQPPRLDEHRDEILSELGLAPAGQAPRTGSFTKIIRKAQR